MSFAVKLGAETIYFADEFWSKPHSNINMSASATDVNLNDIVVNNLPSGITIRFVFGIMIVNRVNTTQNNDRYITGVQFIRIKEAAGAWDVDDIDLIDLPARTVSARMSSSQGGCLIPGTYDVKSVVDGDGTYNIQWEDIDSNAADWTINSLIVGLKVYWSL